MWCSHCVNKKNPTLAKTTSVHKLNCALRRNFSPDRLMLHTSESKIDSPWVMVTFTMNLTMCSDCLAKKKRHFEFSPGSIKHHKSLGPWQETYTEAAKTKTISFGEIKSQCIETWHDGRNDITLQKETTADSEWNEMSCDQIDHHQFWWKVHGQFITRKNTIHSAQRNIT